MGRKRKVCCAGPAAPSGSRAAGGRCRRRSLLAGLGFPAPREDVSPRARAGGAGQQEILVCVFLFLGFRPQSRTGSGSRGDRTRPVIVAWALRWGPPRAKASLKTGQVMVVPLGRASPCAGSASGEGPQEPWPLGRLTDAPQPQGVVWSRGTSHIWAPRSSAGTPWGRPGVAASGRDPRPASTPTIKGPVAAGGLVSAGGSLPEACLPSLTSGALCPHTA